MKFKALFLPFFLAVFANAQVMLLSEYKDEDLSSWYISEKLDGVRGVWDGKDLKSRSGYKFNYPDEFIKCFPNFALDGELYTKRGEFDKISSITSNMSEHKGWSEIKFHIFDIPEANISFDEKYTKMQELEKNCKNIVAIKQIVAKDNEEVFRFLDEVVNSGGEGLVARSPSLIYENARSSKILKIKKFKDGECEVIRINEGSGKYKGLMGSISCLDTKSGVVFKIGTGFSDEIRTNPPEIGQIITYKYQNLTKNNKPRFAVFLRYRDEL